MQAPLNANKNGLLPLEALTTFVHRKGRKIYIDVPPYLCMKLAEQYLRVKEALLTDPSICQENRAVFAEFFAFEEQKLKRQNGLAALDDPCRKTLIGYTQRFRNANKWFCNKPWKELTREDIQRVYDDLEEGRIRNRREERFADRSSYYNKVFRSKPFGLVGKAELAREVLEYSVNGPKRQVRFISEETFRKMVSVVSKPVHLLLFWLAWDIGENINSLIQLRKKDLFRRLNEETNEPEYIVNLPSQILKRSRQSRSEPTLYPETTAYADMVLEPLRDDERVFLFEYRQALKLMHQVVSKTGVRCAPTNDRVNWKDLRSGMACHLLRSGWTTDEVNSRLGHAPSSKEIDAYVSYLAIDRRKPKRKLYDTSLQDLKSELEKAKQREKLFGQRLILTFDENRVLRAELEQTRKSVADLRTLVERTLKNQNPMKKV
jgi:hypothetical protein